MANLDGFPEWAKQLSEKYYSRSFALFVLHGNVHDLIRCPGENGKDNYVSLPDFLATQVFGNSTPSSSMIVSVSLRMSK